MSKSSSVVVPLIVLRIILAAFLASPPLGSGVEEGGIVGADLRRPDRLAEVPGCGGPGDFGTLNFLWKKKGEDA